MIINFYKLLNKLNFEIVIKKRIYGTKNYLYFNIFQHFNLFINKYIKYETSIYNNIQTYVVQSNLIFDIGSNIGQYALKFSNDTMSSNSKIVCFEPDFINFTWLDFNVKINKIKNVFIYNIGISNENTESIFYIDSLTGGRKSSFIKNYTSSNYIGNHHLVKLSKIDNFIELYGFPDFIKIDVEGYESLVIESFTKYNILKSKFLIEVRSETKKYIFNYFDKLLFTCFIVDNKKPQIVKTYLEIPDFANLLFINES
jgi:FkbM family methyltransferase